MQTNYKLTVVVEPCEEGGYFARCGELQGCFAEAETYDEVIAAIREVIEVHIECRLQHGEKLSFLTPSDRRSYQVEIPAPVMPLLFC